MIYIFIYIFKVPDSNLLNGSFVKYDTINWDRHYSKAVEQQIHGRAESPLCNFVDNYFFVCQQPIEANQLLDRYSAANE